MSEETLGQRIAAFLEEEQSHDPPTPTTTLRPAIEIREGELPRLVHEAEDVLLAADNGIFQRAGMLMRVARLEEDDTDFAGIKRKAGSAVMMPVTHDYLRLRLAHLADWQRYDRRAKKLRAADPPGTVVRCLAAMSGDWRLPHLEGLIGAPTLRSDGSLIESPGYDARSGLFGTFARGDFPSINPKPTRDDALAALALLRDLFSECAFVGGAGSPSAAVAIAATITACVRRSLSIAPAFGFSAHKQSSGKTTTAQAAGQVASGIEPAVLTLGGDEAEIKKCLMSILLAGDGCVLIDNVAKPVDSPALCAALTSATYRDRLLGANHVPTLSTAVTWLMTGNHLEVVGDLTSRTLLSTIDPEMEHPETRAFRRDLAAYIAEHRGKLLAAALTIPLAYINAGVPTMEGVTRSRFTDWDRLVRRPLLWLGVADPLATQEELRGIDPVREDLLGVLRAWRHVFGDEPTSVKRAIEEATGPNRWPDLHEALQAVAGEKAGAINSRRLGRYMVRNARRIEDGMRIEIAVPDLVTKNQRFRVRTPGYGVTGVTGVSPNARETNGSDKNIYIAETNTDNTGNTGGSDVPI